MTKPMRINDHPYKAEMQEMWENGKRAREIFDWLSDNGLPDVSYQALGRYGQRNWSERVKVELDNEEFEYITELVNDIHDNQGKVSKVVIDKKSVMHWEMQEDGKNKQVPKDVIAQRIEFIPSAKTENSFVYERATIPNISIKKAPSKSKSKPFGMKLAASIPDIQIGAYRHADGTLEPTHDEQALDVALQILNFMEQEHGIDLVVNQGDNLDLPMLSSHRSGPGYTEGTMQYAIDRGGALYATQRAIAPNAKIIELASNHHARLVNSLVDNLPALVGISRAGESEPILSIQYLLRFDDYDIEYIDGYPDAEYWASNRLRFEHGKLTSGTPGATARKHLRAGISTVYGHHHHAELLYQSDQFDSYDTTSFAGSPGMLCRKDGFLPSSRTGLNAEGKLGAQQIEKWQAGIWFIWYADDTDSQVEPVHISNGKAIFRGREFISTVDKFGKPIE